MVLPRWPQISACLLTCLALACQAQPAVPAAAVDLFKLDLDSLRQIKVVTAARRAQTVDEAPGSVTVFSREEIDSLGVRTLDELLNFVPGMRSYQFAGPDTSGKTVIETRGVYEPYGHLILLLLDGQRLSAAYNGNFTGANRWLSLTPIERVEIIRGPGSALYGGNAMLAVINLISARDTPKHQAIVEAGDFGHVRSAVQTGSGPLAGHHWRAWLEWQRDDGDDYPNAFDARGSTAGTQDPHTGRDAMLSAGTETLELQLRHHWRRSEDFYLLGRMANGTNASETEQNNARLSWRAQWASHDLTFAAAWLRASWDGLTELAPAGPAPFSYDRFMGGPALAHEEWQLSVDALWTLDADNLLNYGLAFEEAQIPRSAAYGNYDTRSFAYLGEVMLQDDDLHRIVSDQNRQLRGAYLQWDHRFNADLRAVFGARIDDYRPGEQATTPRATLLWHRDSQNNFELQYAEAYRPPSQADQFVQETPIIAASPPLDPMRSKTLEASWQYRASDWDSNLTLYALNITDLIGRTPLPDGRVRATNSGDLQTRGIEVSYCRQFHPDWLLRFHASHIFSTKTVDAPPDIARSENYASRDVFSFSSHWRIEQLRVDLLGHWASAVAAQNSGNDYRQWHVQLRYPLAAQWELYGGLRNGNDNHVLGAEPGRGLGTDDDGSIVRDLPQRGRQWLVGLRWQLQTH